MTTTTPAIALRATTDMPPGSAGRPAPLLSVTDLAVSLPTGPRTQIQAVHAVTLEVHRGERVGIVGESGSGKSVTGRAIAGLLPANPRVRVTGSILIEGREMVGAPSKAWDTVRSQFVGMIFQDPLSYLNPVMKIGRQVREALPLHHGGGRRAAEDLAVLEVLALAGLPDASAVAQRFPYELSGGMRQRVLIAIAIAKRPDLVIADEPTTALDATVQRHVLATLDETVARTGTSLVLISHDLAVVASMTDRIVVMYRGRVVEAGATHEVLENPRHPYTQALLRSVRSLTDDSTELWSITPEVRAAIDAVVDASDEEDAHAP